MKNLDLRNKTVAANAIAKTKTFLIRMKVYFLVAILFTVVQPAFSQVTLGTSPYSENFSTVGTALPTGWTVRTAATASALGTAAAFTTTQTAWSNTGGIFSNVASANSLTSAASAATQNASTDRAPSIRQTGTVGDPGAAFVLQIANTTSKTAFNLSFKLMELDPTATAGRTTTWNVDYGFGATPISFTNGTTVPATLTTFLGTGWGTTNVTLNFGSALDNNAGPVWIRVVAKSAATGSGSRPQTAIDDVSLSWTAAATPTITLNTGGFNGAFGSVLVGNSSASSSFIVSGANLTNNIVVTPPAGGFEIRTGVAAFSTSAITLTQSGGVVGSTTIDVRFSPTGAGAQSGNVTSTSTGATTQNVAVSGTGTTPSPTISITGTLSAFTTIVGVPSASQSYMVSGNNLTANIIVTPPTDFEIRVSPAAFSNSAVTLIPSGGTVSSTTIDVRYNPATGGSVGPLNIAHTSTGATTQNQPVSGTGIAEPTTSSTIAFGAITRNSIVINLSPLGNGSSRIVVVRQGSAVSYTPTDGIVSTGVNSIFTTATDQGAGNRIVFDGAGNTVTVTGLTFGTTYHVAVYEYNGSGTNTNYKTTGPGINNTATSSPSPVPMISQPALTYTENFADIANWTNDFNSGIGASRWGSVAVNATGTIPDGVRTTVSTATFTTATTSGGVQRGGLAGSANPAGTIVQLATGSTDVTASNAIEFYLNFTGVNAGTLSFDWATVFNSTGDRFGSLRVYTSTDGIIYTELTGAAVLNKSNNVTASGSITTVALPASFTNSSTARIRFYEYNGNGGTTGSRAKIAIDNLTVTATQPTKLAITNITPTSPIQNANFSVTVQAQDATNTPQNVLVNTSVTLSLNTGTGILGGTLSGIILAGTNSIVISNVTYNVAEAGVILTATRTSGDVLTAGNSAAFTVDPPATPTITLTGTLSAFLTGVGTQSTPSQTYSVQGADLVANLVITPPVQFEVSLDNAIWVANPSSISIAPIGVTVAPTTIFVRYNPASAGPHTGNISHTSTNAITKNEAVSGATSDVEPTTSSVISFSNLTTSSAVVNFTGGNGAKRILVVREISAVSFVPADGVAPTGVNSNFSTATDQGSGNKIVYDGTGTTVTVTNLTIGSTYHFAVYEYNGTAGTINYRATPGIANIALPAPIPYIGGTYTQDFNSLPKTGSFSFAGQGSGPFFTFSPPINATSNNGWQIAKITGTTVDEKFGFDNGASNAGSAYSYGTTAATDRAFGALSSTSNTSRIGAIITNTTGASLSTITITYTGEQWRDGGVTFASTLSFGYQVGGTDISTGSFIPVTALDFSNIINGVAGAALDGNNSLNQAVKTATFCIGNWANGQSLVIRWDDIGNDGLAIDNFSFSASGGGVPNCVAVTAVNTSCPTGVSLFWPSSGFCDSYRIYVGTDNPPTDVFNAFDVGSALSYNLPVLSSNTPYFYKVVPYNVFGPAVGCTIGTFTTGSTFTVTPTQAANSYTENFEGVTPPTLPCGITTEDSNFPNDFQTWKTSSTAPNNGLNSIAIDKNANNTTAKDDWFYSSPMNLIAGRLYRIYFHYRVSNAANAEQFEIFLSQSADAATMTSTSAIAQRTNLINIAYVSDSTTDILPALTGVYYYGFHANSLANKGTLYLDDIQIKEIPVAALDPASCTTIPSLYDQLIVQPIYGAQDYKFKIENLANSYSYEFTRNLAIPDFRLKWAPGVVYGLTYDISVSYLKNNVWSPYGASCPVTMGPFPVIQLRAGSCGAALTDQYTPIYTDSVAGANDYEYRIVQNTLAYDHTWLRNSPSVDYRLYWAYQSSPLVDRIPFGFTYDIQVRALVGRTGPAQGNLTGTWGTFGPVCTVTLAGQPQTQLKPTSCGITLTAMTDQIFCILVSGAGNYRYHVVNVASGYDVLAVRNSASNDYRLSWLTAVGGGVRYNTTYDITVSDYVGGVWSTEGPVCQVTTPASPITQLQAAYCPYTLPTFSTTVYSNAVPAVSNYRYRITDVATSGTVYTKVRDRNAPSNDFKFTWTLVCCGGQNMLPNTAYNVEVATNAGGVWSAYGAMCVVTTGASVPRYSAFISEEGLTGETQGLSLSVYPNPSAVAEEYAIELNGIQAANEKIQLEIYNMLGEKVYRSEIVTKEESRLIIKPETILTPGVYMVEAKLDGNIYREKFVVK